MVIPDLMVAREITGNSGGYKSRRIEVGIAGRTWLVMQNKSVQELIGPTAGVSDLPAHLDGIYEIFRLILSRN
jgi:hypothetical protein